MENPLHLRLQTPPTLNITVLGCGGSAGVPQLHPLYPQGHWGECDPCNPKNRRTRASILLQSGEDHLLIDASPDLREQLFREGFSTPGHIMLTHTHNDHCFGLQELRSYYFAAGQQPTSVYVSGQHQEEVHRVFGYMTTGPQASLHLQGLEAIPSLGGLPVQTFPLIHGKGLSYGLRVGAFAYCTDLTDIPPESLPFLEGLDTWIVDCASRLEKRPGHLILPETVAWINRLQPRQAFLTHMGSSLDYETLRQELPASIRPCFDGMRLSLPLV